MRSSTKIFSDLVEEATHILIVQADNPDADSLGSSLGLSEILNDQGKEVSIYCAVDMPNYLKYLEGWSLVENTLPNKFDLSIIVDASTESLLEYINKDKNLKRYTESKKIVLDHHKTTDGSIKNDLCINKPELSSTSEVVANISKSLNWKINVRAAEYLIAGILGDTQGLSNSMAKPDTFRVVADLLDFGVNREELEYKRREFGKFEQEIYKYKAHLIDRTEFFLDNKLAMVSVNQEEIIKYSPLYNPSALIIPDLLQTRDVEIAVVVKVYDDGKITGTIRSTNDFPYAAKVAEHLGGGGHDYASGFKILEGKDLDTVIKEIIGVVGNL